GGHASAGVSGAELVSVVRLAHRDVRRGEIRDHCGPGQGGPGARWNRDPRVFADFDREGKVWKIRRGEKEAGSEGDLLPEKRHRLVRGRSTARKLARLVEFPVVGEVALGNHPQDPATADD